MIDRPPLPPPAEKGCKIRTLSKQISPVIPGNDLESMATEPVFTCEYNERSRETAGGRGERTAAHLDAVVVTAVASLGVQINEAHLTDTHRRKKRKGYGGSAGRKGRE